MHYKRALQLSMERTLNSDEFCVLTVMAIEAQKIVVTKTGRVFKGSCCTILSNFTGAILADIQAFYIYLKAEGQVDNEPKNGMLKSFQNEFLQTHFNINAHIEQALGHHLFRDMYNLTTN